ncbi:S-layer homology domain-containing protein [Caldifermentibacillus hisashii]|uniref:S-layer homology domain-containing protein n=1 Tax=Caldifermentibacillus hisashii TaxID=996558 RepID=UPI00336892B0
MAKQKTSRKAFATTAAAVMAATAVTPVAAFAASTTSFPDVPAGEYADAINNLVGKGIINGFDDGTFKPNDPVLREQAAKILATALKLDTTGTENYPDVSPDNWSYKYIVAVTKAGIFGGDESGKFNPFANLTRQEAAKIIVEAFDFTGSSELTFGDKANIQSWAVPYVKTAVANGILKGDDQGNFNPNANIKRGDFALMIQRALNAVENAKTPKVESVSAINAKTLEVKFNKKLTVDEQKALEVSAKRDGSAVLVEFGEFDGNKATVVRTNGAEFASGEYVLTITGLGEEALTGEVTVEERTVTEAVVVNDHLLDETSKAKIGFELKDQYGEKVDFKNTDITYSAFNKTQNKPVTINYNSTDGYFVDTATNEDAFKEGDVITISLVHSKSGVSVSKDIKVVAGAQLNSIKLGDIVLPEGKTLLTQDLEDVKVPYTAFDQYGGETELVKNGNVSVIVTDETVLNPSAVTFEKDSDGKTYINIAGFLKAGKTNVILLNKVTGQTTVLPLEVNEKAGVPYSVEVAEGSVDIPANGGTKAVDLVVTDKYGNKVEPKDYVNAGFTVVSSNNSVATAAIESDPTDDNYGKLVITSVASDQNRTARITVTLNATGKSAVVDVKVSEEAKPFDLVISKDSKHATSLLVGGKTTVTFDTFDQYNNKLSATTGYAVKYELKNVSNNAITINSIENGDTIDDAAVTIEAAKAGSGVLVAKLVKTGGASDEVIDTVEIPFTTVANSSEKFTYEIADIPTLYKAGAGTDNSKTSEVDESLTLEAEEMGTNKHAQPIKVNAKAADGSTLTVPNSAIISVTPLTSNIAVAKHSDGTWYVAGANSSLDEDAAGKIRVNVATDEGTKTLEKEVTISKEDIQVKELKAMDAVVGTSSAKAKTSITTSTYVGDHKLSALGLHLWTVDQFGVKADFDVNNADTIYATVFDGIKFTSDDTFAKGNDTITVTDVNKDTIANANSSYRLTIIENGVALDLTVKVTKPKDDETPTAPEPTDFVIVNATAGNDGKITAKDDTVTFSEPVKIEYKVVNNGDDAPTATTTADGSTSTFVKTLSANAVVFSDLNVTADSKDVYVRLVDQTGNTTNWVQISES